MRNPAATTARFVASQINNVGPIRPATRVKDTHHHNARAYIAATGEGWALVVYLDEPRIVVSAGNEPGRWVRQ